MVEPLLTIADELERRDARAAQALDAVERLQREVDELRVDAVATSAFLAGLPAAAAAQAAEERAAGGALAGAEAALRDADAELAQLRERGSESAKLAAARAAQRARDAVEEAALRLERAGVERVRLEGEGDARRAEAEWIEGRAAGVAARLGLAHDVAPPGPGLEGSLEWAARARGELLVARAALSTERDKVVREASELVASVLGEPLAATSVAGVRERLARALRSGSA